jgi:sodium transport system permease protein
MKSFLMNSVLVVFLKEVRENLRDRRTVINTLLTGPLLAPVIFVLIINGIVAREIERADKALPVPVIGAEHAPNLIAALKQQNMQIKEAPADPERAVRERDADLVLRIPASYAEGWRSGEPAQVELIYDASQRDAQGSVNRLRGALESYAQRTGALFAMLPYFFILGAFIGGMALAIDTTAGERERQSLEPLLVNPISRSRILIGKLAATSLFALTSVFLSIVAFSLIGRWLPTEKLGMSLDIGPRFAMTTMLAMLPLVFLIATLQTLAAAFARTFREAQTYLSLLMFVPAVPTMLLSLFPVKTETWMYAVPLMGQQITITRLMRGDSVTSTELGICFACTAIAALLVYAVTAAIYRGERLAIST